MTDADQKDPHAVQVLHRDLSTSSQLNMLLSVSSTMMQFLAKRMELEDEDGENPPQEESHIAVENTLTKTLERIDSIIEDDKRWGLEFQTRLEALFVKNTRIARETATKQQKLIEETIERERAQKEAALEIKSPHSQYRPVLFSMTDGTWVAFLGDPQDMQTGIMGSGDSPAAALKSFDLAFSGGLTKAQTETIDKIRNENITLDKGGVEPAREADGERTDNSRDCGHAGA